MWRPVLGAARTRKPAFWGYPPPPHDYPYHWVILDPKSKDDKVKVTNFKNLPKFQIFQFGNWHYTRHTFWSCLIRCANVKWIRWVLLKIQSGHDSSIDGQTDRRTDRRTDKVIPVYPPINFVEAGGIIMEISTYFSSYSRQVNVATCFLVLPIDKENRYDYWEGDYIYIIYIYTHMSTGQVLGITF